ncbi:MAG: VanZ family protein [Phycisphaerae bacterium]|nr:VanZ family protein [Phycisphaerae bacterium]
MSTAVTTRYAPSRLEWIHSTRLHLVATALLVVCMPFLMLRAYLQDAIGRASAATFPFMGVDVPWVLVVASVVGVGLLALLWPYLNRGRLVAAGIAVLMIAYGQYINDYYFGHEFYELQLNWHYFAYMFFAVILYRDLTPRGYKPATIIGLTVGVSLALSTFDELFQTFVNNRFFDTGDISKDVWGGVMGLLLVYNGSSELRSWLPLRHRRLSEYFKSPGSMMLLLGVTSLGLLTYCSLLNIADEIPITIYLTIGTFVVTFLILHLSQFRPWRWAMITIAVLAIGAQAWALVHYRDSGMVYWRPGLAVYRGLVWPYFDFAILPNGTLHPATKLHEFNPRDRGFFLKQCADIILIGAGPHGEGGHGFMSRKTHFMYNPNTKRGSQVIIQPTPQACETFNRLKKEGKNVLFVVNND